MKAARTVEWTESTTVASKVVEMVATSADSLDDTTGYWKVAQTALLMDTTWVDGTASKWVVDSVGKLVAETAAAMVVLKVEKTAVVWVETTAGLKVDKSVDLMVVS